jgi:alpha-tubulin suppressor-like RCC1 family protein
MENKHIPTKIPGFSKVVQVCCGAKHTACRVQSAMFQADCLYTWGNGEYGQLGHEDYNHQVRPTMVKFFKDRQTKNIKHIACGNSHTLILTIDNTLYAFGNNSNGQLGIKQLAKDVTKCHTPTTVQAEHFQGRTIKRISAKYDSSTALTSTGELFMWGQVCHTDIGIRKMDELPTNKKVLEMAVGYSHTMALTTDFDVYSWGEGMALGHSETNQNVLFPERVDTLKAHKVTHIASTATCSVAVTDKGAAYFWGTFGSHFSSYIPVLLPNLEGVEIAKVVCSSSAIALLTTLGDVLFWDSGVSSSYLEEKALERIWGRPIR